MSEKPQIVRVHVRHPHVVDLPPTPIRIAAHRSETERCPAPVRRVAALQADPDPERYDIRTKWLWLHEAVVKARERIQRKGDATSRRDLDVLRI